MGFYPKHIRQRLHKARMRAIAMAALAGCRFKEQAIRVFSGRYNYNGDETHRSHKGWVIVYPDGSVSRAFTRKSEAAITYLGWFYEYKLGLKGRR